MPVLALVGISRRLPPLPVPVILLWPLVWLCRGVAWLLKKERPTQAEKLYAAVSVFRELRGLDIDMDTATGRRVHIRFI